MLKPSSGIRLMVVVATAFRVTVPSDSSTDHSGLFPAQDQRHRVVVGDGHRGGGVAATQVRLPSSLVGQARREVLVAFVVVVVLDT